MLIHVWESSQYETIGVGESRRVSPFPIPPFLRPSVQSIIYSPGTRWMTYTLGPVHIK